MSSLSFEKFKRMLLGAHILRSHADLSSSVTSDSNIIKQTCLKAAVAHAVGCWEGYVEAAIREFIAKVRVQNHRKNWSMIAQFEVIVDKKVSSLNTPNWEQVRNLLMEITGIDPYSAWVWDIKYSNQTDTKQFFDGIMNVRHAFAHGFDVPLDILGVQTAGHLDDIYVADCINFLEFIAVKTDGLLEHDLKHKHGSFNGWS